MTVGLTNTQQKNCLAWTTMHLKSALFLNNVAFIWWIENSDHIQGSHHGFSWITKPSRVGWVISIFVQDVNITWLRSLIQPDHCLHHWITEIRIACATRMDCWGLYAFACYHQVKKPQKRHTQQKLWFNRFHWKSSTVDSTASSYVPSLNALQLVEQKLLRFKVSNCVWSPLYIWNYWRVKKSVHR